MYVSPAAIDPALTVLAPAMVLLPGMAEAFGGNPFAPPDARDLVLLLVLSMLCTLLPFALSLVALRHMSAFAQQLAVNLEPVYAIVLAILLLGEQHELTPAFYVGVAIILAAVFVHPLLGRPKALSQPEMLCAAESKGVAD